MTGRTHGNASGYRHGCRCAACCDAHTARVRVETRARAQRTAEVPHGSSGYQNWMCRCDVCAQAHRGRMAQRKSGGDLTRYRRPWTTAELAAAARPDLTAAEVAALIGRTETAVHCARRKIPTTVHRGRRVSQ